MRNTILLPVYDTFGKAWKKVYGVKLPFVLAGATMLVIVAFFRGIEGLGEKEQFGNLSSIIYFSAVLIGTYLQTLLIGGLAYMGIQRTYGRPVIYHQMWRAFKANIAASLFGLMVLEVAIGILIGFLGAINFALAIVGFVVFIYLIMRFILVVPLIVDKELKLFKALKISWQGTQSNFWRLLGWMVISVVLYIVSALPLLIGLIWTLPWLNITYGEVYKTLLANTELQTNDPSVKPKLSDLI